jgi:hypothetical protein
VPAFKEQEATEKNLRENFHLKLEKAAEGIILGKQYICKQNHFLSFWVKNGKSAERC